MGRSRNVVRRSARIDLLMGVPTFDLQKPACSKVTLVSENSRVSINPVIVEWSKRKIWVVHPLFVRDASWITAVKPAGVEIECQQLVLVRPLAEVEISLPQVVLAVIRVGRLLALTRHQSEIPTDPWPPESHCRWNNIRNRHQSVRYRNSMANPAQDILL